MTIIESGIIAGIPTGAMIGGVSGKSYGIAGVIGGSFAGMISGVAIGWLYAFIVMFLLSVVGVLWRVALKRADKVPAEADIKLMTPIGVRGIFIAALITAVCWLSFGWPYALAAAFTIGFATAIVATGGCELRESRSGGSNRNS